MTKGIEKEILIGIKWYKVGSENTCVAGKILELRVQNGFPNSKIFPGLIEEKGITILTLLIDYLLVARCHTSLFDIFFIQSPQ